HILKNQLAVFHSPFPLADLAAFFFLPKKIKKVVFWHSDIVRQKKLKVMLDFFINHTLKKAHIILTTSRTLAANSSNLVKFKEKVEVVPLSIDVESITAKANGKVILTADLSAIDLNALDFISFGRLSYYKGINVLIDALTLLHNEGITPSVLIAGQGELTEEIKVAIAREGLNNVHFLPRFLSETEKYLLLKQATCFLFPSVANSEAFGITQLEALALGTPVINTSLPTGVPDVSLDKLTGLTVTPSSPEELAQAMKAIYLNEVDVDLFSRNAKERANAVYNDPIVLGKLSGILAGLLK
ncbi:TPA: glycosyltransferase, partial [Kluyvera georgiana]|nr:glycosyltransferase [Kluyvera georgiana]